MVPAIFDIFHHSFCITASALVRTQYPSTGHMAAPRVGPRRLDPTYGKYCRAPRPDHGSMRTVRLWGLLDLNQ